MDRSTMDPSTLDPLLRVPRPFCTKNIGNTYILASYLDIPLLGLELLLFYRCMSRKQPRWIQFLAMLLIANDLATNFLTIFAVWEACIIPSETALAPLHSSWVILLKIVTFCISGFCAHFYLIQRIYAMSKNILLTICLATFAIAVPACHLAVAGQLWANPLYFVVKTIPCDVTPTKGAWALGFATDIFIAVAVVRILLKYDVAYTATKSIIRKFLLCSVISGGLTALCGAAIIALLTTQKSEYAILSLNLGKLYAITVLTNLALIQGMQRSGPVLESHDISKVARRLAEPSTKSLNPSTDPVVANHSAERTTPASPGSDRSTRSTSSLGRQE